jgi:hypothetical protein
VKRRTDTALARRFQLNSAEVHIFSHGSRTGGRRKASLSRRLDTSSWAFELKHMPTGIVVSGAVAFGHYSRKELSHLKDELLGRLWCELEGKVAARLRVPRRNV